MSILSILIWEFRKLKIKIERVIIVYKSLKMTYVDSIDLVSRKLIDRFI